MKTSLLIQEPPLQVLPSLAKEIGLNNAIVLQQLHWLLENKNVGVVRDGYKWVFNTHEEWQEKNFTWWSTKTIQRIFTDLEIQGLVVIAQLDKNDWNMRNYYRIDYDAFEAIDRDNLSPSKATRRAHIKRTHSPALNNSNTESPSAQEGDGVALTQHERYLYVKKLYAENIAPRIVPIMNQLLVNFSKEYEDATWYEPAFKIYVSSNAGSWTYLEKVCENWKKNGFGAPPPNVNGYGKNGKGMTGEEAAKVLRG